MADEINVQFDVQGPPSYVMEEWHRDPPRPFKDGRYELVDNSFNSLTYEAKYLDWPAKLLYITIVGWFLRSLMMSIFRVTARFDELAPSHRKEYVRWITEAKKPETRAKRITEAVEMIGEGKTRR